MNAFPDSTGDGLTFRVIGEDTTIDPATGEVSVSTEALRDGIEIVVTATNSGGEASSRFRLTVAASTMGSAPALVTAPSLAGSGLVGEALSVDAGVWAGEPLPDIALQWRCGGVDLPGATAASYLPGAAEDGKPVTCRVTAANASGSLSAETAETIVTRPAPQVAGGLADVSHVQGSGPQGVDAGAVFTGGGLVFSVEGGGATIDPATGQVTLPTDALRDGETVRVVASNSGGSAEVAFAADGGRESSGISGSGSGRSLEIPRGPRRGAGRPAADRRRCRCYRADRVHADLALRQDQRCRSALLHARHSGKDGNHQGRFPCRHRAP